MPDTANNIQKMIAKMGSILTYHKDRNSKSEMSSLANFVLSADAFFVLIDNFSHHRTLESKKQCKSLQRQCIPMKSSSIATFTHALSMIDFAYINEVRLLRKYQIFSG